MDGPVSRTRSSDYVQWTIQLDGCGIDHNRRKALQRTPTGNNVLLFAYYVTKHSTGTLNDRQALAKRRGFARLCYAMLCCAMLCYAMLHCAMLCYSMLRYDMLCYALLFYAMLGCSMPFRALLRYAKLCCAML